MRKQEIFDECCAHVIKQGERAYSEEAESCRYLTDAGKSCAIGGPLVKRGLYTAEIEGSVPSIDDPEESGDALIAALQEWGVRFSQYGLLSDIQDAHDQNNIAAPGSNFVSGFKKLARKVAKFHKLNAKVLA